MSENLLKELSSRWLKRRGEMEHRIEEMAQNAAQTEISLEMGGRGVDEAKGIIEEAAPTFVL